MGVAGELFLVLLLVILGVAGSLCLFCWPLLVAAYKNTVAWRDRDRRLIEIMKQKQQANDFDKTLLKEAEEELKQNVL